MSKRPVPDNTFPYQFLPFVYLSSNPIYGDRTSSAEAFRNGFNYSSPLMFDDKNVLALEGDV